MVLRDQLDTVLADFSRISEIASAGVVSRDERRLKAGEVRPAAILFIDVVGFTELSRKLEPESLAQLIDRVFRIFELTAKSCGGYLDKVIGDAALYVFAGHPNFAPPCEAATAAALKLQERAGQLAASLAAVDLRLAVRCGVAFGEVARQAVGGEAAQVTVMGDTVNLAQRLESAAVPGTVLVSGAVLDKIGELFVHEPLGALELKGFGRQYVHLVSARRPDVAKLRGSRGRRSPLVGRQRQLESGLSLIADWAASSPPSTGAEAPDETAPRQPRNRLLVVRGEQAVGKSRFALELLCTLPGRLPGRGIAHATAHCAPYLSLHAFTAECVQLAGLDPANLPTRWHELCELAGARRGEEYAARQRRHLPLLAHVLGCTDIDTTGIRQGGAAAFETGCQLAVRACCELASLAGSQVVLVIEDLQWLGAMRELLADVLANAAVDTPVIVIGTARPEFDCAPAALSTLMGGPADESAAVLELEPLTSAEGAQLMRELLPGVELPAAMLAELHAKASGLPYYYEEFARMLAASGLVREVPAGEGSSQAAVPRFRPSSDMADMAMPDDIRMLLLGRLDMLSRQSKDLAMRASVLGRSFPLSLLRQVERRLGVLDDDGLPLSLAELDSAGVLSAKGGEDYIFEHVLTQQAAYDSLLAFNRSLIHGAAGEELAAGITPGSVEEWDTLPQLIRHMEHAGKYRDAHRYCCELMILLAQSGRLEGWESWDRRAKEYFIAASAAPSVDEGSDSAQGEALYLRAVGIRQLMQGQLSEAKAKFATALELVSDTADFAAVVKLLANLAIVEHRTANPEEACVLVRRALDLAGSHGLTELCGTLHANLGLYEYSQGRVDQALGSFEEARTVHTRCGNLRGTVTVLINMGSIFKLRGEYEEARRRFSEALLLAQRLGDRVLECGAQTNLGVILQLEGDLVSARQMYWQSYVSHREANRTEGMKRNLFNLGEVSFDQQDFTAAAEHYRQAIDLCTNPGAELVMYCAGLGRTLAMLREFVPARAILERARASVAPGFPPELAGVVAACQAYCELEGGDAAGAEAHLAIAQGVQAQFALEPGSQLVEEIRRVESRLRDQATKNKVVGA